MLASLRAEGRPLQKSLSTDRDKEKGSCNSNINSALTSPATRSPKKQSSKLGHVASEGKLRRLDSHKAEKLSPTPVPSPAQVSIPKAHAAPSQRPFERTNRRLEAHKPALTVQVNETPYHLDPEPERERVREPDFDASDDSGDEMPSLGQFHTPQPLSLKIAGMGGVVVLDTEKPLEAAPKASVPLKGRALGGTKEQQPHQQHQSQQSTAPLQSSLSLSAEGLSGTGAHLLSRKSAASSGITNKPAAAPKYSSIALALDDEDDEDDIAYLQAQQQASKPAATTEAVTKAAVPTVSTGATKGNAKQVHVALPQIPYMPPSQPQSAEGALKPAHQQQQSGIKSEAALSVSPAGAAAVAASATGHRVLDAFATEVQLAEVRNMKPNEDLSKQSSQRLMEQLKAKRNGRLNL